MDKLAEIKAFVQKSIAVRAELADLATRCHHYSLAVAESIIEQQQGLKRQAKRLQIISVDVPFFEEAEYKVHIRFNEFTSFIDLADCKETHWVRDGASYSKYSIVIDGLVLIAIKKVSEEHKNAQAI